jgi:hypothetical protein
MAWLGRRGVAGPEVARLGQAWQARRGQTRPGQARLGLARQGWHGVAEGPDETHTSLIGLLTFSCSPEGLSLSPYPVRLGIATQEVRMKACLVILTAALILAILGVTSTTAGPLTTPPPQDPPTNAIVRAISNLHQRIQALEGQATTWQQQIDDLTAANTALEATVASLETTVGQQAAWIQEVETGLADLGLAVGSLEWRSFIPAPQSPATWDPQFQADFLAFLELAHEPPQGVTRTLMGGPPEAAMREELRAFVERELPDVIVELGLQAEAAELMQASREKMAEALEEVREK